MFVFSYNGHSPRDLYDFVPGSFAHAQNGRQPFTVVEATIPNAGGTAGVSAHVAGMVTNTWRGSHYGRVLTHWSREKEGVAEADERDRERAPA